MAFRKRFIHPDLFSDWELIELGLSGVLTFIGMICSADDVGNLKYCCNTIYAKTFPMTDDVSVKDVKEAVEGLIKVGLVKVYEADGQSYLHINRFHKYQKPNHPSNPEHPIDKWSLLDEDLPEATRRKIMSWTNGVVSED